MHEEEEQEQDDDEGGELVDILPLRQRGELHMVEMVQILYALLYLAINKNDRSRYLFKYVKRITGNNKKQ